MYAYASYPVNSHANELGTSILWFIFLDYSQLIDSLAFKLRVQINHCLWIFKVMPLLMGDTNPFHPQCVKFQPLPVLFNPPWLRMQQSALCRIAALEKFGAASSCCLLSTDIREHGIASGSVEGRHYCCQHSGWLCWGCSSRNHAQLTPAPCCHGSCGHRGASGTCWL